MKYETQKKVIISTFLIIPLVFVIVFFIYPAIGLVVTSFSEWKGYGAMTFNGIKNYIEVFSRPTLFGVIVHNMAYLVSGILQIVAAIFLAILINKKFIGKNLFRAIIFLPFIINSVSVVYMFGYMFQPAGVYNNFLVGLHLISSPLKFLSPEMVNFSLAFISFWQYLGFYTVIFLAGLQTIPNELYEASKIDGANAWHEIIHITIPNLGPLIQVNTFLVVTGSLRAFDAPWILLKGGPGGASDTLMTKTVEVAFRFNNYGTAAALSLIIALIIIIVTLIQRKVFNEK